MTCFEGKGGSSPCEDGRNRVVDEKKRKRMMSNRESARRSRMKREQRVKDLNDEIAYLTIRNKEVTERINAVMGCYLGVEFENTILRAEQNELKERLQCTEIVAKDYCQMPLQPLSFQYQPIITSAGVFQ